MQCVNCRRALDRKPRAAIAIFVHGDEYLYSWFPCARCCFYTVEAWHDRFLGEGDTHLLPPIPAEEGNLAVNLIAACPSPQDKLCGCASHRALYTGRPVRA